MADDAKVRPGIKGDLPEPEDQSQPSDMSPGDAVDQGMTAVVGALRYLFVGLRVLILVLLVSFFFGAFLGIENFGGFFHIEEHEEGMLFRFGRLRPVTVEGETRDVFGSGVLRWRWPYPVDEVERIDTQRPISLETRHFWPQASAMDPMSAAAAASMEQGLRPGYDGYLLTGDTNIMHMTWRITYRVVDPKTYFLNFNHARVGDLPPGELTDRRPRGPEVMVQRLLEQAVLREVSTWSADEVWQRRRLLTESLPADPMLEGMPEDEPSPPGLEPAQEAATHHERLAGAVRERLARLVADTELGIAIQELSLLEVQPPRPTLSAFIAVNEAVQERSQTLDAARSYRTRVLADARARAAALIADGEAYESRIVARAKADAEVFQQIQEQYLESPESVLVALYSDTLREVLPKVKERYVMPSAGETPQELRLLLGPESPRRRGENLEP